MPAAGQNFNVPLSIYAGLVYRGPVLIRELPETLDVNDSS
jgi:hypothetical protein